jgi:hypothetical protein
MTTTLRAVKLSEAQWLVLIALSKIEGFSTEPFGKSAHILYRRGFAARRYQTIGGFWKFRIRPAGRAALRSREGEK